MNVLLFGLGAVGSTYALILQRAGAQVSVVARSNYKQVSSNGLDIRSQRYGNHPNYKFHNAVASPDDPSLKDIKFDYIVCCNKAIGTVPSVPELLSPCVSEDTTFVIIQNGVGNDIIFRKAYPNNVILSGVTWVKAIQESTGVIVHEGDETMQFGCHWVDHIDKQKQQTQLDNFVALLEKGGSQVEVVPQIGLWRWKKTIWNCCWNNLTALTLCNTANYLNASESAKPTAVRLVNELTSVAESQGYSIEPEYVTSLIERSVIKSGIISSMYTDAKNGRVMEIDAILKGPLAAAKEAGIDTPVLETIDAIASAVNWRFAHPDVKQ